MCSSLITSRTKIGGQIQIFYHNKEIFYMPELLFSHEKQQSKVARGWVLQEKSKLSPGRVPRLVLVLLLGNVFCL